MDQGIRNFKEDHKTTRRSKKRGRKDWWQIHIIMDIGKYDGTGI
jgi:hypothetical protein